MNRHATRKSRGGGGEGGKDCVRVIASAGQALTVRQHLLRQMCISLWGYMFV